MKIRRDETLQVKGEIDDGRMIIRFSVAWLVRRDRVLISLVAWIDKLELSLTLILALAYTVVAAGLGRREKSVIAGSPGSAG